MDAATFRKFQSLIYEESGINLREGKETLVANRIGKRLKELEMDSAAEYYKFVTSDNGADEIVLLLDSISTNVTSFFREPDHFDFFSKRLQEWFNQGQRKFRIWSAACSTGEEPYTLAMVANETLRGKGPLDLKILATDISTRVLRLAMTGHYGPERLESVPKALRLRYFEKVAGGRNAQLYEATSTLKQLISYSRINLSSPPFPMKGPFDIIFIRNVMIYFDATVRQALVDEAHRLLKPGGYLILGHSETLTSHHEAFQNLKASIYLKKG